MNPSPQTAYTPWIHELPGCTCRYIDKIRVQITDFWSLYNIVITLDRRDWEAEKGASRTVTAFEEGYLHGMYHNLERVAEAINYASLDIKNKNEVEISQIENLTKERLESANKQLRDLGKQLTNFRELNSIPDAMNEGRLNRLMEAAGVVLTLCKGRSKVFPNFCVYHAFLEFNSRMSTNRTESRLSSRASHGSQAQAWQHHTRCERTGTCVVCDGTVILAGPGNKRSLFASVVKDKHAQVTLRAWACRDPMDGEDRATRRVLQGNIDLRSQDWLEASIATETGAYTMRHSIGREPEVTFGQAESKEAFDAFLRPVSRGIRHTMRKDLGLHEDTFNKLSAGLSVPTVSALSDIQSRMHDFETTSG